MAGDLGTPGILRLSLRSSIALLLFGVAVYMAAFPIYFAGRVGRSAAELDRRSDRTNYLYGTLASRSRALRQAVLMAHEPIPTDSAPRRSLIAEFRSRVTAQGSRLSPENFSEVPHSMRIALAGVDDLVTRLQTSLLEYAALLDLGRDREAEVRRFAIDSLDSALQTQLAQAQLFGLEDLVSGTKELQQLGQFGIRAVLWWLGLGLTVLGVALLLIWRRVNRPLRQLEDGLNRVAAGDFAVRLNVTHHDELGRVKAHFNQVTETLYRRAQVQGRFVAAGELIAGIAHEVNNPLMAISAVVSNRLTEGEPIPREIREELFQVLRQTRRAGKLLTGLLRFVRPESDGLSTADLRQTMREALDLISYRFTVEEIALDEAGLAELPNVRGNPGRVEQVLVNVLSNATDALKLVPPPRTIRLFSVIEAGMVELTVEDNGPGIPAAIATRLFHPFTSTKGEKGTGLGLYISREIARDAGGDLRFGRGTLGGACFVLSLPIAEPATPVRMGSSADQRAERSAEPARASRIDGLSILLVEDEPAVRGPVARFLRRRGGLVTEAGDGLAALEALEAGSFDVIVADVRMPRMDGAALYLALQRRFPPLVARILFLSGDISQIEDLALGQLPARRMIIKPVELSTLEDAIADLMTPPRWKPGESESA